MFFAFQLYEIFKKMIAFFFVLFMAQNVIISVVFVVRHNLHDTSLWVIKCAKKTADIKIIRPEKKILETESSTPNHAPTSKKFWSPEIFAVTEISEDFVRGQIIEQQIFYISSLRGKGFKIPLYMTVCFKQINVILCTYIIGVFIICFSFSCLAKGGGKLTASVEIFNQLLVDFNVLLFFIKIIFFKYNLHFHQIINIIKYNIYYIFN